MHVSSKRGNSGIIEMGHPSKEVMSSLRQSLNYSSNSHEINRLCEICLRAKQTRIKFPLSHDKVENLFELIHYDIWGLYKIPSSCGAHYFLTIVDYFSRGVWVYLMKEKSETEKYIKLFVAMIKTQFDKVVKIIRIDNGSEFKSRSIRGFYAQCGMIHQTSCVETPQQNGRVERKHRHLLNVARALRFQAKLPLCFWGGMCIDGGLFD